MEEILTKKERRELRRQEREGSESEARRSQKIKRTLKILILLFIMAGVAVGIYFWLARNEPEGADLSQAIEILEAVHVLRPAAVSDYNSNPPTSGRHWADANAPISRGVHDEEFPDEALVHNLEHGEIWISYKKSIPDNIKEELKSIARDSYKVVLTIREKNDMDIAVAAWGRLDKFNLEGGELDRTRIENFINRYRNRGPELVP